MTFTKRKTVEQVPASFRDEYRWREILQYFEGFLAKRFRHVPPMLKYRMQLLSIPLARRNTVLESRACKSGGAY